MYSIGVVTSQKKVSQEIKEIFEKKDFHLEAIEPEKLQGINAYNKFSGFIIEELERGSISQTCGLLLKMRQQTNALIWILSKQSTTINRQIYLQLGADGNIKEESFPEEFVLYLSNFFKRQEGLKNNYKEINKADSTNYPELQIQLKLANHSLIIIKRDKIKEIELTKLEYQLMELLSTKMGTMVTYNEIYQHIWKGTYDDKPFRIANLIFHIREKLKQEKINHVFIRTIREKGYMIKL